MGNIRAGEIRKRKARIRIIRSRENRTRKIPHNYILNKRNTKESNNNLIKYQSINHERKLVM